MATQPDIRQKGTYTTLNDQIKRIQTSTRDRPEINADAKGQAVDFQVKQIEMIADPKIDDRIKVNLVNAAAKSHGVTDLVARETRDPVTGEVKPGDYTLYSRLTSDAILKEVDRLDKKFGGGLKEKYADFAGSEFGRLFGSEVRDLKDAQAVGLGFQKGDKATPPKFVTPPGVNQSPLVADALWKVNRAMERLHAAGETFGVNSNEQIYNLLTSLGYVPREGNAQEQARKGVVQFGDDLISAMKRAGQSITAPSGRPTQRGRLKPQAE